MQPIRKGSLGVKIPFAIKSSDPIFQQWSAEVRDGIQRLRDRVPQAPISAAKAGSRPFPFQIIPTTKAGAQELKMIRGATTIQSWRLNAAGTEPNNFTLEDSEPQIGSGVCANPPLLPLNDPTVGFISLAPSTTYGIWLTFEPVGRVFINSFGGDIDSGLGRGYYRTFEYSTPKIEASSTAINSGFAFSSQSAGGEYEDKMLYFIGQVVVDAAGVGVVTIQHRSSDVVYIGQLTYIPIISSLDPGNTILNGSDGGAYLP